MPEILTERLRLRGHAPADFDLYAALWADPDVARYITGRPSTAEESWARLLRQIGHWVLGFGYWVIEDRADGTLLGEAGLSDFRRDVPPPWTGGRPECGWLLTSRAHGRGYATEAVSAIVAWGDRTLPSDAIQCMIAPVNRASLRVAEKCGFRLSHVARYRNEAVTIMVRPAEAGGGAEGVRTGN